MSYNLHNTILCRLCAEPDSNGTNLEVTDAEGRTLRELINKHLPLKVDGDDKFPRTVCQDCHLQVQNLINFFALLIKGQNLLHRLNKQAAPPLHQNALKGPLYDSEHTIRAELMAGFGVEVQQAANEAIPKRKRGRPRKDAAKPESDAMPAPTSDANSGLLTTDTDPIKMAYLFEPPEDESPPDGKRRRKKPARFMEAVQGNELEKVFLENGVLEDQFSDEEESGLQGVLEVIGQVLNSKKEVMGVMEAVVDNSVENARGKFQFKCETCQAAFTQEAKFVDHVATHRVYRQECVDCGVSFCSSGDLMGHIDATGHSTRVVDCGRPPSPGEKPRPATESSARYKCTVCNKHFKFATGLKNHLTTEHEDAVGGFECDECGKRLKHLSSLRHHKSAEHSTAEITFACIKCGQTFRHKRLLQKHQVVHSDSVDGATCPECGKFFKSKSNLTLHLEFHRNGKRHICATCNQTYSSKTSLVTHMRTHSGEKRFECDLCKKSFGQKGNLLEHMRTHTGEKPFKCDICGKSFTTSSQRRLHIKRHLDVKEFRCEICGKDFLYKDSLTVHLRRHSGERPYKCDKCHKTFTERSGAMKHVRTHTGERPFECNLCGKTFSDNSNLGKHRKTHKTSEEGDPLVSDILTGDLNVGDLALVDGSDAKQYWVVKQDSEDGKDGEAQQVIYITYNDPDDPNSKVSEALLVGRDEVLEADSDASGGKMVDVAPDAQTEAADTHNGALTSSANPTAGSAGLGDHQLPEAPQETQIVMDEHGQPLRFTTADGSLVQVTTVDGESFQLTTSDGTSVPVILRITSDSQMLAPSSRVDVSSAVGDVSDDALTSAVVDSLDLVSPADVRLLSEATFDLL